MTAEEDRVIEMLIEQIENLKSGLDPNVLSAWYSKIESDAKASAPVELAEKIEVIQDPILPMKFEFKVSRRAVKYVIEAIEKNLPEMPLATRLYFQKLEEIILAEAHR
jgi:hypothetical protein